MINATGADRARAAKRPHRPVAKPSFPDAVDPWRRRGTHVMALAAKLQA
jgi:hypothetical protein